MPAQSKAQMSLMQAALRGATFDKAKEVRASMTTAQIEDFTKAPAHKPKPRTHAPPQTANRESHSYNWRTRANLKRGK